VALLAFAADRRAAVDMDRKAAAPAVQQSIDIACPPGPQQQTRRTPWPRRTIGQTDALCRMRTESHTRAFNDPFSGTTQMSRYRKGESNLDFTEARDSEWQLRQLGRVQVCTSLQQITTPAPHHRPDALPAAQPTASKH